MRCLALLLLLSVVLSAADRGLVPLRVATAEGIVLAEFAESHALVIGCSQYRDGAWQKLEGVPGDTAAVATALEAQGFRVQRLDDPDGAHLQQALRELVVGPGGTEKHRILVYYAGHGATVRLDDKREMGYLVPVDAPSPIADPSGFRRVALSMGEVEVLASATAARHALFIFDACFSGSLFKLRAGAQQPPAIAARMMRPVRQFITSGSANQQVPDQSVFRRYLVRGIGGEADANRDGWVSGTELGEFVFNNTVTDTRNGQTPQIGTIRDPDLNAGDFVFRAGASAVIRAAVPAPAPVPVDARDRLEFRAVLAEYPNAEFPSIRAGHELCAWVAVGDGSYTLNPRIPAGDGQECIVPRPYKKARLPSQFLGLGPLRLSGRDVSDVAVTYLEERMALAVTFTELGARRNLAFTTELHRARSDGGLGRLAIVLNGIVRSDPMVAEPSSKNCLITGMFTPQEIENLRRALSSARPAPP